MTVFSVYVTILALMMKVSKCVTPTTGSSGYSTYYAGNGPIILVSNHGGATDAADLSIDARTDGCLDANSVCDWTKNCANPSSSSCGAKTVQDSFTREIADCLRTEIALSNAGSTFTNALIINELHREVLDSNRQKEEAAQSESIAEQVWDELHGDSTGFIKQAKDAAISNCGWALLIDVHGQASNDYNHIGYRVSKNGLNTKTDAQLNSWNYYRKRSSVWDLVQDHEPTLGYADILRGANSLGAKLENIQTGNNGNGANYKVLPSEDNPTIPASVSTYYTGGFTLKYHGSSEVNELDADFTPSAKSSVLVDAIQIEVNSDIRKNQNSADRDVFCQDFADAIEQFIADWYDITTC